MLRAFRPLQMTWREEGRTVLEEYLGVELIKYRHIKYGTGVVVGKVEGPICKASMVFATEPKDDKGHTHCLEHLCFMETKLHPRGMLDLLATRCGSQGTNAFTDFDHTQYELEVAGEPGLVRVLPVFMNHVLNPLLTPAGFVTEIFHINGKGEQQGVVYSEMAGRENSEMDLMWNTLLKRLYGTTAPYSYETGGHSSEIAKLTREEIVEYHREVYTTDNLNIIVTGQFDTQAILNTIDQALSKAVEEGGARVECQNRAFSKRLPANDYSSTRTIIQFPSDDMSIGSIVYGFKLKEGLPSLEEQTAFDILFRYLTGLSSSPLSQAFVELEFPIASSVFGDVHMACEPFAYLEFSGVPYNGVEIDAEDAADEAEVIEEEVLEGEEEEEDETCEESEDVAEPPASPSSKMSPLDWFRGDGMLTKLIEEIEKVVVDLESGTASWDTLQRSIQKERISDTEDYEDSPHELISSAIAPELIFEGYPMDKRIPFGGLIDKKQVFENLLTYNSSWWCSFIENTILKELRAAKEHGFGAVEVKTVPSARLAKKNEQKTGKITKANVKKFGPNLSKLQRMVEEAKEANQINLTEEAKATFPREIHVTDVKDIPRDITRTDASAHIETIEVDLKSSFLDLRMYFDYAGVPPALCRYLYLYHELLLESDMGGMNYREAVQKMDEDLVSYSCNIGKHSKFMSVGTQPTCLSLLLCCEVSKHMNTVRWLDHIINKVKFNEEKVRTTCKTLLTDVAENMRDGQTVLDHCVTFAGFKPDSLGVLSTPFSQRSFLRRALKDVPGTIRKLNELRQILASESTPITIVIGGGTKEIRGDILTGLKSVLPGKQRPPLYGNYAWGKGMRDMLANHERSRGFAVGVGGIDTAYICLDTRVDVTPATPREYWALYLLCECISIGEGDLQLEIRGRGLAYGAGVYFHAFRGTVSLDIWECTNVKGCIEGALNVLRQIPNDDCEILSEFNVKNAIGSVVCGLKSKRGTPSDIVSSVSTSAAKGLFSIEGEAEFEEMLHSVTHEDLINAYEEHVSLLLQTENLVAGVVSDQKSVESAAKVMSKALDIPFTTHKSLANMFAQADEIISITVA